MFHLQTLSMRRIHIALAMVCCALAGCATTPGRTTQDDPWQGMNRGIYKFNDAVDRGVAKPLAKSYKAVTPQWFRTGVSHVFANLGYPVTIANELLQVKPKLVVQDTCRLVANTVFGLGGIFDVADKMGLPAHNEDFGQTLARWGVPSGPYLVLPFLGPSTLRDGPAKVADYYLGVLRNTDIRTPVKWGARGLELVAQRAELLSGEATLQTAYDRYGVVRDAWLQRREYEIFDGNPPEEKFEEFNDDTDQKPEP